MPMINENMKLIQTRQAFVFFRNFSHRAVFSFFNNSNTIILALIAIFAEVCYK